MDKVIVIVVAIGVLILGVVIAKKKQDNAIASGEIIQREKSFFRQSHIFTTNVASVNDLYSAMDLGVFSRRGIECTVVSENKLRFQKKAFGIGMTAELNYCGNDNGRNIFRYVVVSYKERDGMDASLYDNIALTAVEKAFLKLDNTTSVERLNTTYTSSFF